MKQLFVTSSLIFFLLVLICPKGHSQDRIILTSGDTIHCSISKVTKKYLFYSQNFNGASAKGKIEKNKISEWTFKSAQGEEKQEGTTAIPIIPNINSEIVTEQVAESELPGKIRFSVNAGPGFMTGNTDDAEQSLQEQDVSIDDSKEYYDKLKLGAQTRASLYFHAWGDYWFGALYSGFYSKSEIVTTMQMDDVNVYYGKLGEHYFVNFAGASFFSASRYGSKKQIGLSSSFSIGPAFYRDEAEMLNQQFLVQGTSLGMNLTLGGEYFIKPRCSVSVEAAFFTSQVKKIKVTTTESSQDVKLDKENYENLSRLELSVGLVYYW